LVVITGLSGSGKSLAANCLEDLGYFCVDNLPVLLIPPFYELVQRGGEHIRKAALVIDVRERAFLGQFPAMLEDLRGRAAPVSVLFFDCSDELLKRRFSETRRPHPMQADAETLEDAIRRERKALEPLRNVSDRVIDTTRFSAHELRAFLKNVFGAPTGGAALVVHVVSFGFKYGAPAEADLVFDVRFLPNPYFVDELRPLDGTDPRVREFLDRQEDTSEFMDRLKGFLDFLVPLYAAEGKSYLTVGLGCTGGKHRSVALAEELRHHLQARDINASVSHRDLGRE
jgi:RNase adapter protein RapZ